MCGNKIAQIRLSRKQVTASSELDTVACCVFCCFRCNHQLYHTNFADIEI